MATGARLKGKEAMKDRLLRIAKDYNPRVGRALYVEMGIELREVIRRTPKDKGDLRDSEHLMGPVQSGDTIAVLIVVGGPTAPYAMIVHEDLEAFHAVGQAKFLESVLMEARAFIGQRVAKRLNIAEWGR